MVVQLVVIYISVTGGIVTELGTSELRVSALNRSVSPCLPTSSCVKKSIPDLLKGQNRSQTKLYTNRKPRLKSLSNVKN